MDWSTLIFEVATLHLVFFPCSIKEGLKHCEHGFEIPILTFWRQNVLKCSKNTADQGSEVQFGIGLV